MAPVVKKRHPIRARVAKSALQLQSSRTSTYGGANETFRSSKEDKRRMKHSSLISRIEKTNTKPTKRRRPSKKLITNLESLANALPVVEGTEEEGTVIGDVRFRHKSLKSRPGAMKKKEKLEKMEKERFGRNMAQMAALPLVEPSLAVVSAANTDADNSKRWAALRGYIQHSIDPMKRAD